MFIAYIISFTTVALLIILFFCSYRPTYLTQLLTKFFELSNFFFTYKFFDKFPLHNNLNHEKKKSSKKFAIIVQGPLVKNSEFTIQTLNFYSKEYPKSPIIFSSWNEDIKDVMSRKFKKNVYFIKNKFPTYSGFRNINLQAITTKSAILFAKKLKCNYVLKTRSDTRVYSRNVQDYLLKLIKFYQLKKNLKIRQKKRIISTSFTLRYRIYGISDMIMFGDVDDLYNYFNVLTTQNL